VTPGNPAIAAKAVCQVDAWAAAALPSTPGPAITRAWADNASRRSRDIPSKPFITDRITIRAATPTQTPASDTQVMKETKNLRFRART
jgi:hypothetical protein